MSEKDIKEVGGIIKELESRVEVKKMRRYKEFRL